MAASGWYGVRSNVSAYEVDWADELAELTPDELGAYTERMAEGGSMGQAAILVARYRATTASPAATAEVTA